MVQTVFAHQERPSTARFAVQDRRRPTGAVNALTRNCPSATEPMIPGPNAWTSDEARFRAVGGVSTATCRSQEVSCQALPDFVATVTRCPRPKADDADYSRPSPWIAPQPQDWIPAIWQAEPSVRRLGNIRPYWARLGWKQTRPRNLGVQPSRSGDHVPPVNLWAQLPHKGRLSSNISPHPARLRLFGDANMVQCNRITTR